MRFLSLLFALAVGMRAWGGAAPLVPSGIDFSAYEVGVVNIHTNQEDGSYHWYTAAAEAVLSDEVVSDGEENALKVFAPQTPSEALLRAMTSTNRESCTDAVVPTYAATEDGPVYSDATVTFTAFGAAESPAIDGEDRLVVFARAGKLYVTAGRYVGTLGVVEANEYPLASPVVDVTQPHRLTVRTIPTVANGLSALAFTLAVDGTNAVIDTSFAGPVYRDFSTIRSLLTDEARYLLDSSRLFPSLTTPGLDTSIALTGLAFTGEGTVGSILFTNAAPEGITAPERLFELAWDSGVASLEYWQDGATHSVPEARLADHKLFLAVPAEGGDVNVAVTYGTGYTEAPWKTSDCEIVTNVVGDVTNLAFRVAAGTEVAAGQVCTYMNDGGFMVDGKLYATFAEAKVAVAETEGGTIKLSRDVTTTEDDCDYNDNIFGSLVVEKEEDIVLDLNGRMISNGPGSDATIVNYGKLKIIDTADGGGGKVMPYADYFDTDAEAYERVAVQNAVMTPSKLPELTLEGGLYDGIITNQPYQQVSSKTGTVVIVTGVTSGEPKFIGEATELFPYQDWVTNTSAYFTYDGEKYWTPFGDTNTYIWCGGASTNCWTTDANWRGGTAPASLDAKVIFPATTGRWSVDFNADATLSTNISFKGDTELHGAADFSGTPLQPSDGVRLSGDATLTWKGVLAPKLTDVLDTCWSGTVVVAEVGASSPKLMSDIASWGTATSKVIFRGVRGYCHAASSYTIPYELVLDGSNGYAWKNDAGFTGSVLSFAKLSGSGTFISPKNTISNYQTIRFLDVAAYTGKLEVKGKRVVLGSGKPNSAAGSITWSDGVTITVDNTHYCLVAAFLGQINATTNQNDVITAYGTKTVDADKVIVRIDGGKAELSDDTTAKTVTIVPWTDTASDVNGKRVAAANLASAAKTTSSIRVSTAALQAKSISFAPIYTATSTDNGDGTSDVSLELNENAVPVIGEADDGSSAIAFTEDGMIIVTVLNAKLGLWYCLEHKASLTDETWTPEAWQVLDSGNDGKLALSAGCESDSGYYRVVVTDVAPEGWEEE